MSERDDKEAAATTRSNDANDNIKHEPQQPDEAPHGDLDKLAEPRPLEGLAAPAPSANVGPESSYVAPPRVEIVADGVGRLAKARVPISVRAPRGTGPTIVASTTPDLFQVVSAPTILPTVDEATERHALVVGFGAQQPGKFEGTLAVRPQTPGFGDLHVPLTGYTDPASAPARVPSKRELAIPREVDLGEHVVGSDRIYDFARVGLGEPGSAKIRPFEIMDAEAMQSRRGDDGTFALKPTTAFRKTTSEDMEVTDKVQRTLDVGFAPMRAGFHKAVIEVPITWADGVTTKQYVNVTARAHPLTKADENFGRVPEKTPEEEATEAKQVEHHQPELNDDPVHDFGLVSETAQNVAMDIADQQKAGVGKASKQATGYVQKMPEPSVLVKLAESALTIANATLARTFANAIAGILSKESVAVMRSGAPQIAKDRAKAQLAAVADPIREGIKALGKRQVAEIVNGMSSERAEAPERTLDASKPFSGFFDAQESDLKAKISAHRQLMTDTKFRLEPLLKTQPEVAIAAQRATLHALEDTKHVAENEQFMASTSQYLTAVASGNSADEKALERRLAGARELGADSPHNYTRGMLRIVVEVNEQSLVVRSAKLHGISRVLIEQLASKLLVNSTMPIVVTARSRIGDGTVTRDNHGVIRASGTWPIRKSEVEEGNKVEAGRDLLERLLSRSLKDWGVTIEHDDAGTHTEQAP
jgi:hypothetical protein